MGLAPLCHLSALFHVVINTATAVSHVITTGHDFGQSCLPCHEPGRATPGHKASDGGAVVALKVLARPPRGNTVCEHHGLGRKQLQHVQFAEQVQVRRHS